MKEEKRKGKKGSKREGVLRDLAASGLHRHLAANGLIVILLLVAFVFFLHGL